MTATERDPFDAAAVPRDGMWHAIEAVDSTGSTNKDLLDRARGGAAEGLVLVADQQTAGRGRMGRSWVSPPRAALTFSFLLRPRVKAGRHGWIPLLTGVAEAAAIDGVTGIRAKLKWPNDVLVPDGKTPDGAMVWAKLAGILAESTGDAVVVGIGLNVSTERDELPEPGPGALPATSLRAAGSELLNREQLLTGILLSFERRYEAWQHARGNPAEVRAEYKSLCETLNRPVRVEGPGGRMLSGDAVDVDTDGRLVVLLTSPAGAAKAGRAVVPVAAGDVVHVRLCQYSGMGYDDSFADDEQPVLLLHPHWKTLVRPLFMAVVVVAAALVAIVVIPSGKQAAIERLAVGVVALLALMIWLMVPFLRWRTTSYGLTTRRLRLRTGIITRHGRDIPLARINDVSFDKGLLDRMLGCGRLVVESAGEHGQIVLTEIPHVENVHTTLFRLVEDEQQRLERQQRYQP